MKKENKNSKKTISNVKTGKRPNNIKKSTLSYVNVNRSKKEYKDKYKKGVEKALKEFAQKIGKSDSSSFTPSEWRAFFTTITIPLDKDSERKMIDLFIDNREELNKLLVMHNYLAGENLAEVYFKRYEKESPTKWYDLEDFKQLALEGLAIAASRFDISSGNKFITYATWWVMNKVLKPSHEKGSHICHSSLDAKVNSNDLDGDITMENIITPSLLAPDWEYEDANYNPASSLEKSNVNDNVNFCDSLRRLKKGGNGLVSSIDKNEMRRMTNYLMSIVEKNKDSYGNRQIFLYMFRKIFNKCYIMEKGNETIDTDKLNSYVMEAAKSKAELLSRLDITDYEYKEMCNRLMRGNYDGI